MQSLNTASHNPPNSERTVLGWGLTKEFLGAVRREKVPGTEFYMWRYHGNNDEAPVCYWCEVPEVEVPKNQIVMHYKTDAVRKHMEGCLMVLRGILHSIKIEDATYNGSETYRLYVNHEIRADFLESLKKLSSAYLESKKYADNG
jgi:hypothetical protein